MYELTPSARDTLRQLVEEAARHTLEVFLAAASLDPKSAFVQTVPTATKVQDLESNWRDAALRKYKPGSWKHTVLQLIPWAVFAPADVHGPNRALLQQRYPRHSDLPTGTNVTINELVYDKLLVKVGPGQYAPAINGVAVANLAVFK